MVDAVMRWRVEDPFEGSQPTDYFCVEPELVQQVQLQVHQVMGRWDDESDGQVAELWAREC